MTNMIKMTKKLSRALIYTLAITVLAMECTLDMAAQRRTLTIIAPAAPGGGWDQTSRNIQQVLQRGRLVRTAKVLNIPGAGGTIGLAQFVDTYDKNPDVLMTMGLIMVGAVLTNKSPVKLDRVTPVARLTGEFEVLVVPASSPYKDLNSFIEAWKKNPGSFAIAGGSAGGTDHMLAGLLAKEAGIDVTKVNYIPHSGGGESIASIVGGHVTAGINGLGELVSFIQAGQMRALAISSEQRVAGVDIPTFMEQGVNLSLANWRGVVAAPGITSPQWARLSRLVADMYESVGWQDVLKKNNWIDMYLTGPEFDAYLKTEDERAAEVLRSIGLVN